MRDELILGRDRIGWEQRVCSLLPYKKKKILENFPVPRFENQL